MLLVELAKKDKTIKNEDVFSVLRWGVTGKYIVMPLNLPLIGDICEVLGKEVIVKRLEAAL